METNETFEQPGAEHGLALNFEAQSYLREAGKWAYFLGILGFIGTGLILLVALFIGTIFSMLARYQSTATATALPAAMGGLMSFFYILIAVFNFFFAFYLFQFGSRIKKGILFSNEAEVTNAFGKLKSFFKLWGITTIVVISLYILIFIIMIVVGIGAATMLNK